MLRSILRRSVCFVGLLVVSLASYAEQFVTYDNYEIHYNAFNSTFITPDVAKATGFSRSKRKALVNVSVLKVEGDKRTPVGAFVTGEVSSLIQTKQDLRFKKIDEGDAIYYLSDFGFTDDQVLRFEIQVQPDPNTPAYGIQFEQRFYAD